jgi:hypothetical protein
MAGKFQIKPKRIVTIIILFVVLGLIVSAGLWAYPRAIKLRDSYRKLDAISDELNLMVQKKDLNIDRGKSLFEEVNAEIKSVREEVQPYYGFLKKVTGLPWVGEYASQFEPVIEYTFHTVSASENLIELIVPVMNDPVYSKHSSRLVQQINDNQSLLVSASDHLTSAGEYHQLINMDLFPEKVQNKLRKIEEIEPLLKKAISVLKLVPALTGADKPITYLVMLQNSDELRPTGGFITAFGLVRLEQGVVTLLEFKDSTSNNYISELIEAPAPLKQILLAHYWLPRDANWYASFPESAVKFQELYYYSTGIETDGVIALNQTSIQKILQFTGPVIVDGVTISAETVNEYMIMQKMDSIIAGNASTRKDFITPLMEAVIESFSQQPGRENLINFVKLIQSLTSKGDLLLYSNNQEVQALLHEYHLDGELRPGLGDYLMLVDANLGYDKLDLVIKRKLKYTVNLEDPGSPTSRIEVVYQNPTKGIVTCRQGGDILAEKPVSYLIPGCYGNFWRILGANGTSLSNFVVPNFDDSYFLEGYGWSHTPESNNIGNGINEVSGLIVVPANSEGTIILDRVLPITVISEVNNRITYTLNIQKQSGIDQLPFRIEITVAPNAIIETTKSDLPLYEEDGKWVWDSSLSNTLTEFQVTFIQN